MLKNLRVKNLALIDESEVDLYKGLNILTGETGAGKSIIIGSMNLALGEKLNKDMIRDTEIPAIVELIFSIDNDYQLNELKRLGFYPEDGEILLARKYFGGRTTARINGETVSLQELRDVAHIFIDIYGQSEHQTLLNKKKHLSLIDEYGRDTIASIKDKMKNKYEEWNSIKNELADYSMDDEIKRKEMELLSYEINEIEAANLRIGEEEELADRYRVMSGADKVKNVLATALNNFANNDDNILDMIGRVIKDISSMNSSDEEINNIINELNDAEGLLQGINHDINKYYSSLDFSDEELYTIEERLNLIRRLEDKYGNTIESILESLKDKSDRLKTLQDVEEIRENLQIKLNQVGDELNTIADSLSEERKKVSNELVIQVENALKELNFLDVNFAMEFNECKISSNGRDEAEFMISLNPFEPLKPLISVSSGGELSRIMLAIKSVTASRDKVATLIFDEIDAGISGRTAQMVSEKMNRIGKNTQVIAITHLPQIAAMADHHYLIEKSVVDNKTISRINLLDEEACIKELARMLGGVSITNAVIQNAEEMRALAMSKK